MTGKKVVNGTKVITGNQNVDLVSVAPFEVNDEKINSDENVMNAITCDFPCKILKNFTLTCCSLITSSNQFLVLTFRHDLHAVWKTGVQDRQCRFEQDQGHSRKTRKLLSNKTLHQ